MESKRCWICNGIGWFKCRVENCLKYHNKFAEHECERCNGTGVTRILVKQLRKEKEREVRKRDSRRD